MQYYLNGFKPGDPRDSRAREDNKSTPPLVNLPDEVDVLIVGCGPAGLILAAQLAAFPDITTRIIEQKSGPLLVGQADGISGRSSEIFQALGFSQRVMEESYFLKAITFWKHDEDQPDNIIRTSKAVDGRDVFSEFPHVVLNQARVHEFLLDVMRKSPAQLKPDYYRRLLDLEIQPTSDSNAGIVKDTHSSVDYPVTVSVERGDPEHEGQKESVKARYVVGCDGARSAVRRSLSLTARGDSANQAWGVMDLLVVTDFPDIRIKSIIQSASEGTLLIIPREGGHLVRFYIEMEKLRESERASTLSITSDRLIAAAQRILHPYTLEVKEVAWWSVYEIGQRLCDKFDNVAEEDIESHFPNVFIAGDACHTHSPKAGQGMNVSMHDSFNLGWKLASVIRGYSSPQILHTYSAERREIAEELITFDRELAKMFSAPVESSSRADDKAIEPTELQKYMVMHDGYVSGTMCKYGPSIISATPTHQHLARKLEIGKRFNSAPVIRLADARPVHLGHVIEADGRWRIFVFASAEDPADNSSAIHKLAEFLEKSPQSPVQKYTPAGKDVDALFDVIAILQQGYLELSIESMPAFLRPSKGVYGLRDYEKLYCPDLENGDDIFDTRGINRDSGCMVIVRPDQHVSHVLPLDAYDELAAFFDGFMV
jgi:phenol 2-monooxygenase